MFGLIKDIIDSSFGAFEYQRYETLQLSPELLAYEVVVPSVAQAIECLSELMDCISYFSVSFKEHTFVPVKYSLCAIIEIKEELSM